MVDDEILVLSQLDLPPSTLRFFGSATVKSILPTQPNPEVYHTKIKTGKIKNSNYSETSILVENLAKTKEGAQTLIDKVLEPPFGKIASLFGGKGVVVAEKQSGSTCKNGESVILKMQRSVKISKEKSYN